MAAAQALPRSKWQQHRRRQGRAGAHEGTQNQPELLCVLCIGWDGSTTLPPSSALICKAAIPALQIKICDCDACIALHCMDLVQPFLTLHHLHLLIVLLWYRVKLLKALRAALISCSWERESNGLPS